MPFTVHDLRGPNNTSQALCRSGGGSSLLPGDFVLSLFRLTRDIRRRVDPVCFFIDRYRNGRVYDRYQIEDEGRGISEESMEGSVLLSSL